MRIGTKKHFYTSHNLFERILLKLWIVKGFVFDVNGYGIMFNYKNPLSYIFLLLTVPVLFCLWMIDGVMYSRTMMWVYDLFRMTYYTGKDIIWYKDLE